jgi:hypothetical protein
VQVSLDAAAPDGSLIFAHPDSAGTILRQPGSALVVRTEAPAELLVEVSPLRRRGSTAAIVNVEALAAGDQGALTAPSRRLVSPEAVDPSGLRLLGHVAGIGDVLVNAGEWIAGPAAPSRIEGIAVEWPDRPAGVTLRYAVNSPRAAPRMSEIGSFVGSRGRSGPVTGLTIELSGPAATGLRLRVEALFLGSPITRATGKRVVIGGVTGREPLVGLRLAIDVIAAVEALPAGGRKLHPTTGVRVFRSRAKADEAVA